MLAFACTAEAESLREGEVWHSLVEHFLELSLVAE